MQKHSNKGDGKSVLYIVRDRVRQKLNGEERLRVPCYRQCSYGKKRILLRKLAPTLRNVYGCNLKMKRKRN